MKKKLTNNFGMKIVSLMLAIVFWLVVVAIEDPEGSKSLELPVTKVNEELIHENDKTYEVIEGNTVTITVRARESVLKNLTAKDFVRNANELFSGSDITLISSPKPGLGMWE